MKNYPYYEHPDIFTIKELLLLCDDRYGNQPAFLNCGTEDDGRVSFRRFRQETRYLGTAFIRKDLMKDRVAILSENSYNWILSFFAVTCAGKTAAAINTMLPDEELCRTVWISDCAALIYSPAFEDLAVKIREKKPEICLLCTDEIPSLTEEGRILCEEGDSTYDAIEISGDDIAAILFTSGTTNHPKAVMLSNRNISSCMVANCRAVNIDGTSLLVLPLYHALGLVVSLLSVMLYGYPSYINRSLKTVMKSLTLSEPRVIIVVPMFVEMLAKQICDAAAKQGVPDLMEMIGSSGGNELLSERIKNTQEFRALLGNTNVIVCGGAHLDEKYINFFRNLGITVLNGYGTTECSPVIATNRNECVIPESAGFPVCGVSVRISEAGEIEVSGDNVMTGYYNNDEANAEAFTEDGWYRTGDLGYLDEDGALHLTGRASSLIILSNGENIPAETIEEEVYAIPFVQEALVYQDSDMIVAEVFLSPELPDAADRIDDEIRALNLRLPVIRNIGKVIVRDKPFEKTATQKIRRDYK